MKRIKLLVLLAFTVALNLAADCVPPAAGLAGWWPADGSGDSLFAGGPATPQNGATFTSGIAGQAFQFDGIDDYVATTLDAQPSAMPYSTWEAWVYPTRLNFASRQQILSTDDGGYDRSLLIESGAAKFAVFTGNSAWQTADATPNEWQHVAVVFTPTNIFFYRNGVQMSFGQAPAIGSTGARLNLGRNPSFGEYFQGAIDEATVYRRALSAEEIQAIYTAGAAGKCKAPASGSADLALTVDPVTPPPAIGSELTYTVNLKNNGPAPATGIYVAIDLPAVNASFVSATFPSGAVQQNGSKFEGFLGGLSPSATAQLVFKLTATRSGEITNHLSVLANESDPNLANNDLLVGTHIAGAITAQDGDWGAHTITLLNTPEAALMTRTGDIDNLGFGWPAGFNPFSGASTPQHSYPWVIDPSDPAGTDRIFVPTSYNGHPPGPTDGYTSTTTRPANLPQPIRLTYAIGNLNVTSAALQMFVDDFQASYLGSHFQAQINGLDAPFISDALNQILQTGPIGKLLTFTIPAEFLPQVRSGVFELSIDDPITGAADGFAVDFVKLLVNPGSFAQVGTLQGRVTDATDASPIAAANIWVNGSLVGQTAADGTYNIQTVAGLTILEARKFGYITGSKTIDVIGGSSNNNDFALTRDALRLQISNPINGAADITWPGWATAAHLEFTPSLTNPEWAPVNQVPTQLSGLFLVKSDLAGASGFYRLSQ